MAGQSLEDEVVTFNESTFLGLVYAGVPNTFAATMASGSSGGRLLVFSKTGTLAVTTGVHRVYNDSTDVWTILSVRASVGTAPAGAALIVDITKSGTTVFTTQANRPTIAIGANTSGKVTNFDVTTVAVGEYFTVDVDQIGSTTAGSDLSVQIEVA